jgi:hypothetical protein
MATAQIDARIKLILLITALLISSNAFAQTRRSFAQPASYPTVTLCEFARNHALYDGKIVRVVGLAYVTADKRLFLNGDGALKGQCEGRDSTATIWAGRSPSADNPVDEFIKKLSRHTAKHERLSAKVEVVGKVVDGDKNHISCFGPRFWVEATSIKQLAPTVPLFLE